MKYTTDGGMTIINKNKQIQPGQVVAVPPLEDFHVFNAEIEKLKKLCSYIRQEEKKAASDIKWKCEDCKKKVPRKEEEKQKAKEKAQVLKNYVIIRSVGVADNLFQSMAADLIDTFKISARSFGKQGSWDSDVMQIHLDDLDKIKREDMTLGKIITSEGRLANTRGIGDIFQKINNIHESDKARKKRERDNRITTHPFFDWLQDLMQIKKEEENMVMIVDEMIKMRNDIAHNIHNVYDSADQLLHKIGNLTNMTIMIYFASFVHLSRGKKDNGKNASICKQCFSMTLDEFYAITDKHKKT